MNRNQKLAIGCGGIGCVGLLVLSVGLGAFLFWRSQPRPVIIGERPGTTSSNSNSNSNADPDPNANRNLNSGSNNSSDSPSGSSSLSDDDRHRLFQAAGMTHDQELIVKVLKKIGLFKADNTPAADYPEFIKNHIAWAVENRAFVNSVNTPETARAYIDQHLPQ